VFTKRIAAVSLALAACNVHAQSVPSNIECNDIPGTEKFLSGHKIVMVGENHGTKEMPMTFVRLVCAALRQGNTVSVGLELPSEQTEPLNKYLQSNGDASAKREFLGSAFWETDRDGRSSIAYADMIDTLRALQRRGFPLSVFPLHTEAITSANVGRYDEMMADRVWQEYETHVAALVLSYTGRVHSMKKMPVWARPHIPPPMGVHLTDLDPVSILLESTGGSSWDCRNRTECGQHSDPVRPALSTIPLFAVTVPEDGEIYTAQIEVGITNASPPAATE
jgi:hypothetical protein